MHWLFKIMQYALLYYSDFLKKSSNPLKLHDGILDLDFFIVIQLLWVISLAKSRENLFFSYLTASNF